MPRTSTPRGPSLPVNPWACFFIFLAANTLLSYFSLPLTLRIVIGLLGLGIPFAIALWRAPQLEKNPSSAKEFLPPFSARAWVILAAAAVFLRFYRLTTLSVWPFYDDSLWGWMALRCNERGFHLFRDGAQFPATYAWGLALLFRWLKPSLFTLWFYPALLSVLTVAAGAWAVRIWFSRSLTWLVVLLLAFGFWPVYVGRVADQMVLVLLAEFIFWGLLGWFFKAESSASRNRRALGLGAAAGLGFYIFISWATVAALGGMVVLAVGLQRKPRSWLPLALFGLGLAAFLAPLLPAGLWHSAAAYSSRAGFWSQAGGWGRQWGVALSYIAVLFWGVDPSLHTYQPAWGGFLNPVLDSFFLLGLLDLGKKKTSWLGGTIAALLFFLLPGMLTYSLEPLRVLPILPLLFGICGWGWRGLLVVTKPAQALPVLIALGAAILGLDFYHLAVKYHDVWDSPAAWSGYGKSIERYRASSLLEETAKKEGPGLIFDDFTPGLCDPSLSVADYSYNALRNPSLCFQHARWAAVLANVNYKPFLQKRFPQGKAFALSRGLDRPDGGWMLWMVPVTPADESVFEKWRAASLAFTCYPYEAAGTLLPMLEEASPAFENDPFLQSCYWEKRSDLAFRTSGFKDTGESVRELETAVQKGYPAAHLYLQMGVYDWMTGDRDGARRAFGLARRAPLDLTTAANLLAGLETAPEMSGP